MADATTITPSAAPKATTAFTHSRVSHRFAQLLHTLELAIAAERDIQDLWSFDPAFRDWRDEAELLWQRAAEEAQAVFDSQARRATDRVLIEAARILHYALGTEHRSEYDATVTDLAGCSERLALRENDAATWRTHQLLHMAESRLAEIGTLEMIPASLDADEFANWPPIAC